MKLALSLAALIVVGALGLFVWCTGHGTRAPVVERRPTDASESGAPALESLTPALPMAPEASREVLPMPVAESAVVPAESSSAQVRVRVVSQERGEPVEGQRLFLHDAKATSWSGTTIKGSSAKLGEWPLSDAAGGAKFEVDAGVDYRLEPESQSAAGIDVPALAHGEVREVELVVVTTADRTVWGRIVDADTGRALGEGLVRFDADRGYQGVIPVVRAHADGTFELQVRSWERRFASAVAEGYARVVFALEPGHETPEQSLDVRLSRVATLEIVVLDGTRPADNALVELTTAAYQLQQDPNGLSFYTGEDPRWLVTSDRSGLARMAELPPRVPLKLTIDFPGHALRTESEPILLLPGEQRRVEIALGTGATILGRVEDGAGRAVVGCKIVRIAAEMKAPKLIDSYEDPAATTRTDDQGRFRFDDVPDGTWLVGPQLSGEGAGELPVGLARPVEVQPGSLSAEVVVRVDRGLYVQGIVLDPDGMPAASCLVSAHGEGWCYLNDQADENGRFSIGPMPAGTYSIQAGGLDFPSSEPLEVEAGAAGLELHLPLSGEIHGRIVDASGLARACEFRIGLDEFSWMSSQTEDGTLDLRGLLPRTYSIGARAPDGSCGLVSGVIVRAREKTDGVVIVIQPGARLKLRYEGKERFAQEEIRIGGELFWADGHERGTARVVDVPAGEAEVRWRAGTLQSSQHVTLSVGEERELTWAGTP